MASKEVERILTENINLVRHIAHQVRRYCSEPFEDLEQLGCIGLLKAIDRFDADKGIKFSCYALPYIRGEMMRYLRDKASPVNIPRTLHDLHSRITALERTGIHSDAEIASRLEVSVDKIKEARNAVYARIALPLPPVELGASSDIDDKDEVPTPALLKLELDMQRMSKAFEQLEDNVAECLKLTFEQQLGTAEVALALQCSGTRVRKLIAQGLKTIKASAPETFP